MDRGSSQRENQQKLRQIGQELSRVDASANRLKSLESELQKAVGVVRKRKPHRCSQLSSAIWRFLLSHVALSWSV